MKFTQILPALAAALCSASAVPKGISSFVPEGFFESRLGGNITLVPAAGQDLSAIQKRGITHVYLCDDWKFTGLCTNLQVYTNTCYNVEPPFDNQISSIGPDQGTTCVAWTGYGCTDTGLGPIVYPGIQDLRDYGVNDAISSVICS